MTNEALPQFRSLSLEEVEGVPESARHALRKIQDIVVFSVPLNIRFRGVTRREGILLRGPSGWGECAPFWDYDARVSARWLRSALSLATTPLPIVQHESVPLNVTIPVCDEDEVKRRIERHPGSSTAKVKVADDLDSMEEDAARVRVTSELLAQLYGDKAAVRIDANRAWTIERAVEALRVLDDAAAPVGGLQYAEQPVTTVEEMADLRERTDVPLAADESIRLSEDPLAVRRLNAADVGVVKVAPLGGIRPALEMVDQVGLPAVVSSALDTSIGIAAGVIMAAALPDLSYACGLGTGSILAADVIDHPLDPSSPDWEGPQGAIDVNAALRAHAGPLTKNFEPLDDQTFERWKHRLAEMTHFLDEPLPGSDPATSGWDV